jgi:hypothetical protein
MEIVISQRLPDSRAEPAMMLEDRRMQTDLLIPRRQHSIHDHIQEDTGFTKVNSK